MSLSIHRHQSVQGGEREQIVKCLFTCFTFVCASLLVADFATFISHYCFATTKIKKEWERGKGDQHDGCSKLAQWDWRCGSKKNIQSKKQSFFVNYIKNVKAIAALALYSRATCPLDFGHFCVCFS